MTWKCLCIWIKQETGLKNNLHNIIINALLTLWFPIQSISSWRSKCVAVTGMPTSETALCSSENIPSMRCTCSGTVTASPSGSSSTPCSKLGLRWGSMEGSSPASIVPWRLGGYSPMPGSRPSKFIMCTAKSTCRGMTTSVNTKATLNNKNMFFSYLYWSTKRPTSSCLLLMLSLARLMLASPGN